MPYEPRIFRDVVETRRHHHQHYRIGGVCASTEAFSGLWLWLFDLVKWPLNGDPASFNSETMSVNAILGGIMVGWGMLMYFVAAGPVAAGNITLTRQMLISVIAWFGVDSTGSYLSQLPGNILLNMLFLVILAVPLWVLSKGAATGNQVVEKE